MTKTQSYDASDAEQVKGAEAAADLRRRADAAAIKKIMETPNGRNWMWSLFERGHIWETSFSQDGATMAFREGERNYALALMAEVGRADPDGFAKMMAEKGQA